MKMVQVRSRLAIFLILVICFGAVFSSIAFFIMTPPPAQSFMGLGVFSRNGPQGYTTAANSTVSRGQTLNWALSISNRMGSAQFVMIIARLENSSFQSPNSTTPSTVAAEIATPEEFVGDGETSSISFTWTLDSTNQTGSLVYLNLTVNGQSSPSSRSTGAVSGQDFRWVFELWTYDLACGNPLSNGCFHYGYGPQTSPTGCWLQVWFNVL